jgi:tannase/feruloyl esterase
MRQLLLSRFSPRCVAALLLMLLIQAGSAQAQEATPAPGDAARCQALVGNRFEQVPDAPTQITSAKVVKDEGYPVACEIHGYIAPQIGVLMRLPLTGWNGRYLLAGCGGLCGVFPIVNGTYWEDALKRNYAVITTDMGHHGGGLPSNAKWAYNNLMAKTDFAFRATHATAILGKAVVAAFYGRPQDKAYYAGCSTGGRQGMIEAERYPGDFDGILAGAATIKYDTSGFQLLWSAMANRRPDGSPIMLRKDVELLHSAVLAACDRLDGLKDGIITDPRQCKFDPASLRCKSGQTESCLSDEKIAVARKVYQGPVDSKGRPIHIGGASLGSELVWLGDYFDDGAKQSAILPFMLDKFRYMTFDEDPGPSWQMSDLDWDRDPERAQGMGSLYTATNPDLRRFKANGGKLLQYHGWADENVVPLTSTTFYDLVTPVMGGLAQTQEFYRLFMIPGMNHCRGGEAADTIDYLTYLENWVEKGQAPQRMVGQKIENRAVKYSRPYFPYPDVSQYIGRGDPNDAASFKRVSPAR